ncbi:dynamin family protein [Daldinia decipiens]|uniref:dynamin family protein n=1 Tax=Daldinia decipiens TaxID=326647 RepID=UPI0020C57B8E|nr:dynamin family protein [Daldinia decipiens]KAI1657624.1 dynamin family protein [Daldinia decipiens]
MPESEGIQVGIQVGTLGDPTLLQKIDKLRSLNVSPAVPLTQLVVVGDRAAGKSSILESLTGFPFSRAAKDGTDYIIEIIYRRSNTEKILASIQPAPRSCEHRAAKLRAFKVELLPKDRNRKRLQDLFEQVSTIRWDNDLLHLPHHGPEYCKDVLQVEITGPREEHLTIIDLPGLPDIRTQHNPDDILASSPVESMVVDFIRMSRTVILAVVPCTTNIKEQRILKSVKEADTSGKRSIAIFTKPDLIAEHASKKEIVDVVNQGDPPLEYFIVRTRKEDDSTSDLAQHNYVERVFFNKSPWDQLDKARVGIGSIRSQLQILLVRHTKQYLFEVNTEVSAALEMKKECMKFMGEPRVDIDKQRTYLVRTAIYFSHIVRLALDMKNTERPVWSRNPQLRLAAHLQETGKAFTETLFMKGHHYKFESDEDTNDFLPSFTSRDNLYRLSFLIPDEREYPELQGILSDPVCCLGPSKGNLIDRIRQIYSLYPRGELGVFGNSILPIVFREQSEKWTQLTLAHLSNDILIIHQFIDTAMKLALPDGTVRVTLQEFLSDNLLDCYRRAINHAQFLLHVECRGKVATSNPNFEDLLANNRAERQRRMVLKENKNVSEPSIRRNRVTTKTNAETDVTEALLPSIEQIYGDVHDMIKTYYGIACARFLDGIHQQAITHLLLDGEQSVFQVFTPERVLSMTSEEVEGIAKESPTSTQARDELEREIESLEKAIEVLHA